MSHCKACDRPIPVSQRYVKEIDAVVFEDLCSVCLDSVRSSLLFSFPNDKMLEDLEALGIHWPEVSDEEAPS